MADSDITKTSMTVPEPAGDLIWMDTLATPELCLGLLRLNGAILYQITLDEGIWAAWWTPEGIEEPIYLWSFYHLEKAKAYVEKRERDNRAKYTYTSTT